jgi:hypothetical protein
MTEETVDTFAVRLYGSTVGKDRGDFDEIDCFGSKQSDQEQGKKGESSAMPRKILSQFTADQANLVHKGLIDM